MLNIIITFVLVLQEMLRNGHEIKFYLTFFFYIEQTLFWTSSCFEAIVLRNLM